MNTFITHTVRKSTAIIAALALILGSLSISLGTAQAAAPNWDTTGSYVLDFEYQGTPNLHAVSLTQDNAGNVTGSGASGAYAWTIDSGLVDGDMLTLAAHYTATADASTTVMQMTGTIAPDGTMSGSWSDNYPGPASASTTRTGTFSTASGAATALPNNSVPTPSPVSPADGSATTTAGQTEVVWTSVTNSIGGITYVYEAANASTTDVDGSFLAPIYTSAPLSTTTLATPNTPEGTYFWHVQATDASSTMSSWSDTSMFIVDDSGTAGSIGGDVEGGSSSHGELAVTSIDPVDTSATADGTFTNGWRYVFHITAPDNETNLAMKFADWMSTPSGSSIAAAGNMRISSAQADNGGATVMVTAANVYTTPALHITGDLDPLTAGNQIEVSVEVAVPVNTANGSYTTNYGVQTLP